MIADTYVYHTSIDTYHVYLKQTVRPVAGPAQYALASPPAYGDLNIHPKLSGGMSPRTSAMRFIRAYQVSSS